jgi:hypothetical protein
MDSFGQILNYLMELGYKKKDIVDKRYMKHFVAFYYYLKRREKG